MLGLSSIFLFNFLLHVFCNSTKTSANSSGTTFSYIGQNPVENRHTSTPPLYIITNIMSICLNCLNLQNIVLFTSQLDPCMPLKTPIPHKLFPRYIFSQFYKYLQRSLRRSSGKCTNLCVFLPPSRSEQL